MAEVKVKDFIEYLNEFDPETPVHLDKDGWPWDDARRNVASLMQPYKNSIVVEN